MRREGDLLLEHLAQAKAKVLLCAPFIKVSVAKRLLAAIPVGVSVEIITRWHPEEVAAGVSDLEVFELVASRNDTLLKLLDKLHAKLYFSDQKLLAGSANLTATALGWCDRPNVELLVAVSVDDEAVLRCLAELQGARLATAEERAAIQTKVDTMERVTLPGAEQIADDLAHLWLPRLAAPERLYQAYLPSARDRQTSSALEAADHDLQALAVVPNLNEVDFRAQIAERFASMPAIAALLSAAQRDLEDTEASDLIRTMAMESEIAPHTRWQIVREWMTYFLGDKYEIAPQSFVTRLRPGAGRS